MDHTRSVVERLEASDEPSSQKDLPCLEDETFARAIAVQEGLGEERGAAAGRAGPALDARGLPLLAGRRAGHNTSDRTNRARDANRRGINSINREDAQRVRMLKAREGCAK